MGEGGWAWGRLACGWCRGGGEVWGLANVVKCELRSLMEGIGEWGGGRGGGGGGAAHTRLYYQCRWRAPRVSVYMEDLDAAQPHATPLPHVVAVLLDRTTRALIV